jgi:DNA-directed RNA polymerase subunit alpha
VAFECNHNFWQTPLEHIGMVHDPLDTVIGAEETVHRDTAAASRHMAAAKKAEDAGDKPTMIAELRRAAAADPVNPDVLFKLAYTLDLVGEDDEALTMYERCCEQQPAPINGLINLAIMYEDHGDYMRAERCLRQVLDTMPNHPRALLYMKDVTASKEMVVEEDVDRDVFKRKAMLDTPVTDFELSVRARTCLKKMNIRTLGDLLRITEAELMSYKNFGETSLVEIRKMLAARGLRLGQGLEDAHRQARKALLDQYKGSGQEHVLSKSVAEMALSVRARKALQLLNIQTLGDLASHTEAELMGIKNFGSTSLKEVRERLHENGLSLRKIEA